MQVRIIFITAYESAGRCMRFHYKKFEFQRKVIAAFLYLFRRTLYGSPSQSSFRRPVYRTQEIIHWQYPKPEACPRFPFINAETFGHIVKRSDRLLQPAELPDCILRRLQSKSNVLKYIAEILLCLPSQYDVIAHTPYFLRIPVNASLRETVSFAFIEA